MTIAGHSFIEMPHGRACQSCGKTWIAVLNDREFWRPGEMGIAHSGGLNAFEVAQLEAEIARIWAAGLGTSASVSGETAP